MSALRLRHRHRLRKKEITTLADELKRMLGCNTFKDSDALEVADAGEYRLLVMKGQAYGIYFDEEPFLTIRGLLEFKATRRYVTVDMGAVRFIANGADCMAPGIVDADPGIESGQGVWIRDEKNNRPLAVGKALVDSKTMVAGSEGKVVKTLHYVGDKIWTIGE